VDAYVDAFGRRPTWVIPCDEGITGFLSLEVHGPSAAEIAVAAVRPELHRNGIGSKLVRRAEDYCRDRGIRYLQVKTLDSCRESPEYDATRRFWLGVGFEPLETFPELWDSSNPALQLVKVVHRYTAATLIETLRLEPHPEGGCFRETWRSERLLRLDDYDGPRNAGTAILFLLPGGARSRWHRVRSDELWLWQKGDPLELTIGRDQGGQTVVLGRDRFQAVVPGGEWQTARPRPGEHGYSLVSCVVVPGFDFADFEISNGTRP